MRADNQQYTPRDISATQVSAYAAAVNSAISPFDYELRSARLQTTDPAELGVYADGQDNGEEASPSEGLNADPNSGSGPSGGGDDTRRIYALVNTTIDPLVQLATTYSPAEIAFLHRLLDAIFVTNNTARAEVLAVSGMQAARLARADEGEGYSARRESQMGVQSQNQHQNQNQTQTPRGTQQQGTSRGAVQGTLGGGGGGGGAASQAAAAANNSLTLRDAESVLTRLTDEGWLVRSRRKYYSLSPRALLELKPWLLATYNELPDEPEPDEGSSGGGSSSSRRRRIRVKTCLACADLVTVGQRCANLACTVRVHDGCLPTLFRAHGGNHACPQCKTPWADGNYVGERAAPSSGRSGQPSGGGGGDVDG